MRKSFIPCFIILGLMLSSSIAAAKQIQLSLDWAVFQLDEQQVYLEVYYSFPQSEINYRSENGRFTGQTLCQLKVFRADTLLQNFAWKNQNVLDDSSQLDEARIIVDQLRVQFLPGKYQFRLILSDLQDLSNADSCGWELLLPTPDGQNPYLSDIELASSIQQDPQASQSRFFKNTLVVIPNPNLIFNSTVPALFFYIEAYNLRPEQLPQGYQLSYFITDESGQVLPGIKPRTIVKKLAVHPSVEFGMLNVGRLTTGTYLLQVSIASPEGLVLATRNKKFYIYQDGEELAGNATVTQSEQSNIFQQMDAAAIEQEYLMTTYLMDKEAKKIWAELHDLTAKQAFLAQFWRMRDTNQATAKNEFREEYLNRAKHANTNFRAFQLEGWRTDRGRVYMVYGPPSDVERRPNEPNSYPFEIWKYDQLQTGVVFVFADLDGYSNYRLLHSNMLGEIHDYNYTDRLQKGF